MAMTKGKHRFESEVRLGLLIIIFILLLLNAASNYVVYKARTSKTDVVMAELTEAATSIGYYLRSESSSELSRVQIDNLKSQFGLSGLIIIPSGPGEDSPQVKAKWFARIAGQLPAGQIPEIARKLLTSDYNSLTRGRNSEYFMVHPADLPSGRRLIILSQNSPDLAYLDGNGRFILIMSIIFIIMIAALYLMLYRHILSPFNQIRRQAQDAGREVGEDNSDVESVVEEYRDLIQELRDKEGQLLKLNAAIRRKADSLEQFNQYLLESMSSGVATVDQQGRILSVNRVAAETMQTDQELLVGRHYGELFGPNWSISTAVKATLEENRNQPYREYELVAPDGSRLSLGVAVSVIRDNESSAIGASVLINDLTEMKHLQVELENSRRLAALGEMSAGLAHQLRNSLGAIMGYGNLVRKRLEKKDHDIESATALMDETREAERLIDRFLNFTRPFNYEPKPENLGALLEELLETFRVRSDCRAIEFHMMPAADARPIELVCDWLLLKQALTNIIENAVNAYSDSGGRVDVALSKSSDMATLAVSDFGCGIESKDIERIFTPFFSSRPSGTGLGLPLASKIVDLHAGRLTVDSRVGEGTTFRIMLPIRRQADSRSPERQTSPTA